MRFERYSVRIEQSEVKSFFPTQKSRSTEQLFRDPTNLNLSELTWRIGLPVSALVLAFLAVPLSAVNPRTGRFLNVLIAVFVYMIYSNLLSIFQAWVAKGLVHPLVGMWGVHLFMLMLLAVLLYRRIFGLRLFQRPA
jgi:lipopolysaccharide export system permease protein